MSNEDERQDLVRIDAGGVIHPVGRTALQRLRALQGDFRLLPSPPSLLLFRGAEPAGSDGRVVRLSGEISGPAALCDIVALIGQASWSGELLVLDAGISRSVFFEKGFAICGQSTAARERIGAVLYRYGALTNEEVETTARAVRPDLRFGEAAIELGFLTREKLFQLMGKQTEEIVYALLLVSTGMFYFLDRFDESRLSTRQNLPVPELLMEGVRRMDETRYFKERIPSDEHVPVRLPDRPLPPEELRGVYEAIDGVRSVAELCRVLGQSEFEVTHALFQLLQGSRIAISPPRPSTPIAVLAIANEALVRIFRELDALDKGDDARAQLSSFASSGGVYDALFNGAGPALDGSFSVERVSENARTMLGDEWEMLRAWMHEYTSFALFLAEPYLRSESEGIEKHLALFRLIARLSTTNG